MRKHARKPIESRGYLRDFRRERSEVGAGCDGGEADFRKFLELPFEQAPAVSNLAGDASMIDSSCAVNVDAKKFGGGEPEEGSGVGARAADGVEQRELTDILDQPLAFAAARSAPAQKPLPSPVITTTRHFAESATPRTMSASSRSISRSNALYFSGRASDTFASVPPIASLTTR